MPFTRVPFFTVNTSVGWRGTYWSESVAGGAQVPEALKRQYFDFNARITGPVFMRIFNNDVEGATKIKHVIEPYFSVRRVTDFDIYPQIVQLEGSDYEHPGDDAHRLRPHQPPLRQEGCRARGAERLGRPELLQPRPSASVLDPNYQTGFTYASAEQVLAGGAVGPRRADEVAAGGLPHRVGPRLGHVPVVRLPTAC